MAPMATRNPKSAVRPPLLPAGLEAKVLDDLDGADLDRCRLEACEFAKRHAENVRFDAVHIVGGSWNETQVTQLRWLDVLCERCDLSLLEWPKVKWTRVELRDCRLSGAKLLEGELDHVRFIECQLEYATFSATRFRQASFERCRLQEAAFVGADLTGTTFVGCDLRGVDFSKAKLQGVDVRSSTLKEVSVGAGDVRGLVVNKEQASVLAQLFGLVVREAEG
jgi:uncharacterized protein YjbI with pentapeptide repeats